MARRTLLVGVLLGACYGDPDRFNDVQSQRLCKLEAKCGGFELEQVPGESCEQTREAELDQCNEVCDYDEDAARACIRGLGRALRLRGIGGRVCDLDDTALEACAEVYTDCEPGDPAELNCDVPQRDGCAVSPHGAPPWWLLPIVPWLLRRRR